MRDTEFFGRLVKGDFGELFGEHWVHLEGHLGRSAQNGQGVVVRVLLERYEDEDCIPTPFYVWGVLQCDRGSIILDVYCPDLSEPLRYLDAPEEVQGLPFVEIV